MRTSYTIKRRQKMWDSCTKKRPQKYLLSIVRWIDSGNFYYSSLVFHRCFWFLKRRENLEGRISYSCHLECWKHSAHSHNLCPVLQHIDIAEYYWIGWVHIWDLYSWSMKQNRYANSADNSYEVIDNSIRLVFWNYVRFMKVQSFHIYFLKSC